MNDNGYNCDIRNVSDGSLNLSAYNKDYLLFFTKFKLPKSKKVKGQKRERKPTGISALLKDFSLEPNSP